MADNGWWLNKHWMHIFKYIAIAILIHLLDRYQNKPRQVDYPSKEHGCKAVGTISARVWRIPLPTAVRHTLGLSCSGFYLFVPILFQRLEPRLRDTSAISLCPVTCTMSGSHILIAHCLRPCSLHSFWSDPEWTLLTWQPPFGIIPLMVVIDSVNFAFSHITVGKKFPSNTILYTALRGLTQEGEKFKAVFGHVESSSLVLDLWDPDSEKPKPKPRMP